MVVSKPSLSGLGRKDSHKKKLIDKISVCHSSNNAIPDQVLQKNRNLILFGNQVQLLTIQLKVGGCAIVILYKLLSIKIGPPLKIYNLN
jgi:hypothetical protein